MWAPPAGNSVNTLLTGLGQKGGPEKRKEEGRATKKYCTTQNYLCCGNHCWCCSVIKSQFGNALCTCRLVVRHHRAFNTLYIPQQMHMQLLPCKSFVRDIVCVYYWHIKWGEMVVKTMQGTTLIFFWLQTCLDLHHRTPYFAKDWAMHMHPKHTKGYSMLFSTLQKPLS